MLLNEYEVSPMVVDPWVSPESALEEYGIHLVELNDIEDVDCVIVAVAHDEFKQLEIDAIKKLYIKSNDEEKVFLDVIGIFPIDELEKSGMRFWRL